MPGKNCLITLTLSYPLGSSSPSTKTDNQERARLMPVRRMGCHRIPPPRVPPGMTTRPMPTRTMLPLNLTRHYYEPGEEAIPRFRPTAQQCPAVEEDESPAGGRVLEKVLPLARCEDVGIAEDQTTSRLRNETGATWSRYAAGDRPRSPSGWTPQ